MQQAETISFEEVQKAAPVANLPATLEPTQVVLPPPEELFGDGGPAHLIARARELAYAEIPEGNDPATEGGRTVLKSVAGKVASLKVKADNLGLKSTEHHRAAIDATNLGRREIKEALDALRDEIKKPAIDWESAEKARVEGHQAELARLEAMQRFDVIRPSAEQLRARLDELNNRTPRQWEEYLDQAVGVVERVRGALDAALVVQEASEAEAAKLRAAEEELAQFRAEKAEREAAAQAKIAAEEKAKADAAAEEKRQADLKEASERATRAAEEAAAKAIQDAKDAAERSRKAGHETALKAITDLFVFRVAPDSATLTDRLAQLRALPERDWEEYEPAATVARGLCEHKLDDALTDRLKLEKEREEEQKRSADEQARLATEALLKAERDRVEAQRGAQEAEDRRRAADTEHRKAINNAAVSALMTRPTLENGSSVALSREAAIAVVKAIALGHVPNVKVNY